MAYQRPPAHRRGENALEARVAVGGVAADSIGRGPLPSLAAVLSEGKRAGSGHQAEPRECALHEMEVLNRCINGRQSSCEGLSGS
jgi:hypothetical protein